MTTDPHFIKRSLRFSSVQFSLLFRKFPDIRCNCWPIMRTGWRRGKNGLAIWKNKLSTACTTCTWTGAAALIKILLLAVQRGNEGGSFSEWTDSSAISLLFTSACDRRVNCWGFEYTRGGFFIRRIVWSNAIYMTNCTVLLGIRFIIIYLSKKMYDSLYNAIWTYCNGNVQRTILLYVY